MRKRTLFTAVILLSALISLSAPVNPTDPSDQFEQAESLFKKGQCEQAETIYQQVIADYPGTDYALAAQEKLACLYVKWGKEPQAQAALENLLVKFSAPKGMSAAVTHVADTSRDSGKHEKACEIYDYVVEHRPQDEHAMWSQIGLVISNACLAKEDLAESAFEKLRTNYSRHPLLGRAICLVADNYRKLNRHKMAREVYQCALANKPDPEFTLWSQMGLAMSNLWLRDYVAAAGTVEELLTDFSKDNRISVAACLIADEYRRSGEHQKACELYQYVLDNWPGTEHALWSQMGLAISNLWSGENQAADQSADKLLVEFAGDVRVAVAACLLADEYRRLERHEKACQLYQYVIDSWPDAEHALWSQMGLAISNIRLDDDNAAWGAIEKLVTQFSKRKNMQQAIQQIVYEYRRRQKLKEAEKLCQYVIDVLRSRPQSEQTLWSQAGLAELHIALGSDNEAQIVIGSLIAIFKDDPDLPLVIFRIGELYWNEAAWRISEGRHVDAKQCFRKALDEWQKIIREFSEVPHTTPAAYYFSARCYEELGDLKTGLDHLTVLVANWPDYEFSWHAQLLIARWSLELGKQQQIPMAEAVTSMREACRKVLSNYPDLGGDAAKRLLRRWEPLKIEEGMKQ